MVTNSIFRTLMTVVGLLAFGSVAYSAPFGVAGAVPAFQSDIALAQGCATDDGFERRESCPSFRLAQQTINRPASPDCLIDDGYGRRTPCSANLRDW